MAHDHDAHELEDHDRGLSHDLPALLSRRRALALLGGAGLAAALAGCGASGDDGASGSTAATAASWASQASGVAGGSSGSSGSGIPEETAGPYPGDGSNGVNVLTESGIVRSDITGSFGSASGVADGVPLTIKLKVLDTANGSGGLEGAAVYVWHCDSAGRYSLYSDGVTEENYLRGVQQTGGDGSVTFTSIYPAAYSGRWPHVHFEVYPSLEAATTASGKLRTSQLALPGVDLPPGVRHRRLRPEPPEPVPGLPRQRHGLQRRLLPAARQGHRHRRRRLHRHPERPGLTRTATDWSVPRQGLEHRPPDGPSSPTTLVRFV